MVRRRVTVHGHVQGVFFRDACRQEAERAGVAGWVRNRGDGTVEAVFEGPEAAVESMCRWCRDGSPQARVQRVEEADEPPAGAREFQVR